MGLNIAFVSVPSIISVNSAVERVKAASDIQPAEIEHVAEAGCCDADSSDSDDDSEAGGT